MFDNELSKVLLGNNCLPKKDILELFSERSIVKGLAPVIVFGFLAALNYFVSWLYGASTTLEEVAAGRFATEPFISIPKETYRPAPVTRATFPFMPSPGFPAPGLRPGQKSILPT